MSDDEKVKFTKITFTDDEVSAAVKVLEEFICADDEYISNHDPIRFVLLRFRNAMEGRQ